jgi:hypothetical protein
MGLQTETTSNKLTEPLTSDGFMHGQSITDKVGFFGTLPVAQPVASANVAVVAAGATTTGFINTTYSGGLGTTGYTIGDVVAALKKLGLIAL